MGDVPRQHSQMNKAYWGKLANLVVFDFPHAEDLSPGQGSEYDDLGKERDQIKNVSAVGLFLPVTFLFLLPPWTCICHCFSIVPAL